MKMIGFYRVFGLALAGAFCTSAGADNSVTLDHDAVDQVSVGHQVNISATINGPRGNVETVRAYFRTSEDERYYFVEMEKREDGTYGGTLPAPLRGAESMEYVILARTATDSIFKTPRYLVQVQDKGVVASLD